MANIDFKTLFHDADANYLSGRITDAYRGFSYLLDKAFEVKKFDDAIYFSYRAMLCKQQNDPLDFVTALYQITKKLLQSCALILADSIENQVNLEKKIQILQLLEEVLTPLDEERNLQKLQRMLYDLFNKIQQEHDLSLQEKTKYSQQMLLYANKLEDETLILEAQEIIARQ